jgi:hypothetical protein
VSLFEDVKLPQQFTPVLLAQNVTTPLLVWTGEVRRQTGTLFSKHRVLF